ncbi:hypothetical protein [Bradyrhizobium sp.]|uniref:hypothetical protein n=1 Tax=Bradyrhizobium sp. TaxID=376 RepID=UPI001FD8CE2A|nr:hypothetical protein [Bradyrhizobium sp.]
MEFVDDRDEDLLLAGKVMIERCARDPGPCGDIGHARALEAESQERRSRAFQYAASAVVGLVIVVASLGNRHYSSSIPGASDADDTYYPDHSFRSIPRIEVSSHPQRTGGTRSSLDTLQTPTYHLLTY